jgi:outer membrane protein OmpA-like peptidoglycan-associated protein
VSIDSPLHDGFFETATADFRDDEATEAMLTNLLTLLETNPLITLLRIEVHTDFVGPAEDNMRLSGERALAIKQWLVDHGIAASRLLAVAFGESRPITSNSTVEGMYANRRVEFHIAEWDGCLYQKLDPADGGMVYG